MTKKNKVKRETVLWEDITLRDENDEKTCSPRTTWYQRQHQQQQHQSFPAQPRTGGGNNTGANAVVPVCGDLSGTRIHSVSHNAGAPIINHENGRCTLDSSVDLNEVLRRNAINFGHGSGAQSSASHQQPYTTANSSAHNALINAHNNNNTTNNNITPPYYNNNSGAGNNNTTTTTPATTNNNITSIPTNATTSNNMSTRSRAQAAPLPAALTAAAANALSPTPTAAQQAAAATANGNQPISIPTPVCDVPVKHHYPCVVPWIIFLLLAAIAIAVIFAVIFGHKDAKLCGRPLCYFGSLPPQKGLVPYGQSVQQSSYSYTSPSVGGGIITPTPAQQATLIAQQQQSVPGAIGQDFSNVVTGLKNDLVSILH